MPVSGRFINRNDLFGIKLIPANRIEKTTDCVCWPLSTIGNLRRATEPRGPVSVHLFNDDVSEGTHGYFRLFSVPRFFVTPRSYRL